MGTRGISCVSETTKVCCCASSLWDAIISSCLCWQSIHSQTCWHCFHCTDPAVPRLCKNIKLRFYVTDAYQQTALCDPHRLLPRGDRCILRQGWGQTDKKADTMERADKRRRASHLNHFIAMRLGISSRHGEDPDLLRLGAAVSQRQCHLPVGGAVCGVGPANLKKRQSQI